MELLMYIAISPFVVSSVVFLVVFLNDQWKLSSKKKQQVCNLEYNS